MMVAAAIAAALAVAAAVPVRPSLAMRLVPGSLPQNQPLQPLPVDATPNISRNIEDSPDAASPANPESSPAAPNPGSGDEANPAAIPTNNGCTANDCGKAPPAAPRNGWAAIVIVIVLILLLGFLIYARWFVKRKGDDHLNAL